jgi:hypothetical protein
VKERMAAPNEPQAKAHHEDTRVDEPQVFMRPNDARSATITASTRPWGTKSPCWPVAPRLKN